MGTGSRKLRLFVFFLAFLLACALITSAGAQGVPAGGGLDVAPSNPVGMPGTTGGFSGGGNALSLNGCFGNLLGLKGNLEFGFLYQFNENISTTRFTFDGLLPASVGHDAAAFGEAHGEFVNFGNTLRSLITFGAATTSERGFQDRIDLSFGGGYRKIFGESLLVGANVFYDTSRLGVQWFGSGGGGLEMAALLPGGDVVDLNYNFYGNLFQGRNSIINAWRNGPGNFDVQVGYSHEMGDHGPDLRLKVTGYQFDVGWKAWGWNAGAEVTSRNGVLSVKAETGRDELNGRYYTVGGFVNVGLQLENLLSGGSPFTLPEPLFKSPRNLRRLLTTKVHRQFQQPSTVVVARSVSAAAEARCGPLTYSLTTPFTPPASPGVSVPIVAGGPITPAQQACRRQITVAWTGGTVAGAVAWDRCLIYIYDSSTGTTALSMGMYTPDGVNIVPNSSTLSYAGWFWNPTVQITGVGAYAEGVYIGPTWTPTGFTIKVH